MMLMQVGQSPPAPPPAPTAPVAPASPGRIIRGPGGSDIILDGNERITISPRRREIIVHRENGSTSVVKIDRLVPRGAVDIAQSMGLTLVLLVFGFPISRAIARWIDRRSSGPHVPKHVVQRLQHMEESLDNVAVEVERISEAQRFSAQLLASQSPEPVPMSARRSP